MRFVLNETGTILTDRNCSAKYIYACEVSRATSMLVKIAFHNSSG
jgi:hypothetical protein